MLLVRRTLLRGWQRLVLVTLITAAGCCVLLLNRCRLHPLNDDANLEQLPPAAGAPARYHFLPEDASHHHLQQEGSPAFHLQQEGSHPLQREDQRTAYTRHLLQQIAQLEQEVAALHAAAAAVKAPPPAGNNAGVKQQSSRVYRSSSVAALSPTQQPQQPQQHATVETNNSTADAVLLDTPCSTLIKQQIMQSEAVKGVPLNNEYEVVSFSHFSWSRVYPSELGLGKRVVEKPIGYRRKDLLSALTSALNHLNTRQAEVNRFTLDDFIEGSYRVIPTVGMQYELVFRDKTQQASLSLEKQSFVSVSTDTRSRASSGHEVFSVASSTVTHRSTLELFSRSVNSSKEGSRAGGSFSGGDYSNLQEEKTGRGTKSSDSRRGASGKNDGRKKNNTNSNGKNRSPAPTGALRTVTLMRPFAPVTVVQSKTNSAHQLINIILPLSGRLQTFQRFMSKLTAVILPHDRRIFLTVVYFGEEGLQKARNIITKSSREANFRMVKLLTLNETFSRGKALQVGAQHWSGGDVLLFMCDVDVVFSTRFLDRCRLHASPGRAVYYPVIFSLYNPGLVYPLQGKPIPEELEQLIISRDTGFWRDFGYGMTCQYRSDFLSVNGFDQQIVGWGGEDVLLYRKYVRSPLNVIRAPDPGIFHLWHPKLCSPGLPGDQYRACISSRALSEASHAHLGLVAFKKDLEKHPVAAKILPGINTAEKNLNSAGGYQAMGEI